MMFTIFHIIFFRNSQRIGKGSRKPVTSFVVLMTVMPSHPDKLDLMPCKLSVKLYPKVGIGDLRSGCLFEALLFPGFKPALIYGIDKIGGIRAKHYVTGLLESRQCLDCGGQLHAVVCRHFFAAGHFLFRSVIDENGAPPASAGIAAAGSVGIYINVFHLLLYIMPPAADMRFRARPFDLNFIVRLCFFAVWYLIYCAVAVIMMIVIL